MTPAAPVEAPPADWSALEVWLARHFGDVATIDAPALARWLDDASREPPRLLDVRTRAEQAVSTLPGALCVDPADDPAAVLRRADAARPLVAYCAVGVRSARLARALAAAGATRVLNLRGGIFDWANRGLRLAGRAGPVRHVHRFDATWEVLLEPRRRA